MPAIALSPFTVNARKFHELIVMPQFGDYLEGNVTVPSPEEGDWSVMDNVVSTRPIIELRGGQNILKRRDATCKLIYSPVGKLSARSIRTEEIYAATEDCQREFYQGCFEDYSREEFEVFGEKVMPLVEKGVAADLYVNKYFGDITRASDITGRWSWNKFNGIFTHIARYIADGTIDEDQTFTIPEGTLTPAQAHTALEEAYNRQGEILDLEEDDDKAFYVDKKLANSYYDWLVLTGELTIKDLMSGKPKLFFKGIEVRIKKWNGPLAGLNGGTAAHAVILTLKGNFIYGADSKYGGGPRENEAVRIFWSNEDNVWKRQIFLKAGTELANPQLIVIGLTEF
jgi:hypothetical protein